MYYRRKLALSLLEVLDRPASRTEMQKYLFLVTRAQEKRSYEFVPYKYGCYSFQAEADKRTLMKYGNLRAGEEWTLDRRRKYCHLISLEDREILFNVVSKYGELRGDSLIHEVYQQYPYYAINSDIAESILAAEDFRKVRAARPSPSGAKLFTIGYEGRPFEVYLRELVRNGVKVLCDVRRNPMSMKFGFNKNQLLTATKGLGITYLHMPELGIESDKRINLKDRKDYEKLFETYRQSTIPKQHDALRAIASLVANYGRVALTCFEANHKMCHRGCVSDAVQNLEVFREEVVHI